LKGFKIKNIGISIMELALAIVGGITLFKMLVPREGFEQTYLESESYARQNPSPNESTKVNNFSPSEWSKMGPQMQLPPDPFSEGKQSQVEWAKKNSIYDKKMINGIPIKDYYERYSKEVLDNGTWYLNKDMPQETNQYEENSIVQEKMDIFTGLREQRDRQMMGKPNKTEALNLFTPQEKTVGYGYQYGNGSGPGLALTRQKEIEDLKETIRFKTNEMPFEKIQVGRGLALGSEVPAAGGFQQYTRIVPDNISDYSSNQLPGRVAGGKWVFSNAPTSQQPVLKNRPNGFYSLAQRGPATGKATMTAELVRPDYSVVLKNQNRSTINYGFGIPLTKLDSFLCAN
jgi:hypothetical protein